METEAYPNCEPFSVLFIFFSTTIHHKQKRQTKETRGELMCTCTTHEINMT
eukprot:jgi/Botrbrau1/15607/Bobra.0264s0007.1